MIRLSRSSEFLHLKGSVEGFSLFAVSGEKKERGGPTPPPGGPLPVPVTVFLLYSTLASFGAIGGGITIYRRYFKRLEPWISLESLSEVEPMVSDISETKEPEVSIQDLASVSVSPAPNIPEEPSEPISVSRAPGKLERKEVDIGDMSSEEILKHLRDLPRRMEPVVSLSELNSLTPKIPLEKLREVALSSESLVSREGPEEEESMDGSLDRSKEVTGSGEQEISLEELKHLIESDKKEGKKESKEEDSELSKERELKEEVDQETVDKLRKLKDLGEHGREKIDYEDILKRTVIEVIDKVKGLKDPDYDRLLDLEKKGRNRDPLKKWLKEKITRKHLS